MDGGHLERAETRASDIDGATILRRLHDLPATAYVAEVDAQGEVVALHVGGRHDEVAENPADDLHASLRNWEDRVHPDDLATYREARERSWRERSPLGVRYRFRRDDGSWAWLEDRAAVVHDPRRGVTIVSGIVFDVTGDREAEDAATRETESLRDIETRLRAELSDTLRDLSEREANYRSLFESVDDMVLVCDTDGRVIEANAASRRLIGYSPEELRGKRILDLHPEDVREEAARIVAAMLSGEQSACPLPLLGADGSQIPTETRVWHGSWNGKPCIFGISRDLVAEREATERFDKLFRANPEPMAVTSVGGKAAFIDVNDAWLRVMGYARAEVIGRSSSELGLFPEPAQQQAFARELRETGRLSGARLQVRTRDGRVLDGIFSGETVKSQGKTYFLTVMKDDTERKHAEAEQLELNRRLEAANRELIGFVNSIAHDLRSPLRTIGSFSQILQDEHCEEMTDDACDAVRRIIRANGRMERLIDALLDLSRLTHRPLHVQPVDLSALAAEVVADLREAEPRRVVETSIEPELRVEADPPLVHILLENLIGNAWKFTQRRPEAHIEVGRVDGAEGAVYYVRDDGAGFDQAYAGRLFTAFERLHDDAEFGGTGIGLATVQRIVDRHDGRAWAEGEVGRGATFYFTLSPDT